MLMPQALLSTSNTRFPQEAMSWHYYVISDYYNVIPGYAVTPSKIQIFYIF
jgi:hypothetical protein